MKFEFQPLGPFDLLHQNKFFGNWLTLDPSATTIVMAFPVEGWRESVVVTLKQNSSGRIQGEVYGTAEVAAQAREQALACLSLDVDGTDWPAVGQHDSFFGTLQNQYKYLRPVLFHSPYEAAAGFIIGHRISIKQRQTFMQHMAQDLGEKIIVDGQTFHAFPKPQVLTTLGEYRGLNLQKVARLQALAHAALEGWLDRAHLRSLRIEDALQKLLTLPGVGPFFAQGILHRGAGIVDDITSDDLTQTAVQKAYQLDHLPSHAEVNQIAEVWRPYRMWVNVLLHIWLRQNIGLPQARQRVATPR